MSPIVPLAILGAVGAYLFSRPKPVAPSPAGGGGVVPVGTGQVWRLLTLEEFEALEADGEGMLNGAPPPHGLQAGDTILLIATTTTPGAWQPLLAEVTMPDPNASIGYATATVQSGPQAGLTFKISTTNEDDAYLWNEPGTITWLQSHGYSLPSGGVVA